MKITLCWITLYAKGNEINECLCECATSTACTIAYTNFTELLLCKNVFSRIFIATECARILMKIENYGLCFLIGNVSVGSKVTISNHQIVINKTRK